MHPAISCGAALWHCPKEKPQAALKGPTAKLQNQYNTPPTPPLAAARKHWVEKWTGQCDEWEKRKVLKDWTVRWKDSDTDDRIIEQALAALLS